MEQSKTAVFSSAAAPMEIKALPVPELRAGEILIRNEYTTLCRSDLNTYTGKRQEKTPTILGHEIVGRIAAFGPEAPPADARGQLLQTGDRVTWAIFASDPESPLARMGIPQKGEDLFKYGHEQLTEGCTLHGGLSQYTVLRRHTPIVRVAAMVPLPLAAIINCAVATVAGALRLAGPVKDKTVIVSGTGMLGVTAVAMAKAGGASQVIAIDTSPQRLATAREFGAGILAVADRAEKLQQTLKQKTGTARPANLIVEVSGAPEAMESTLPLLQVGGTAVWVGATFPQRPLRIEAEHLVRNLITIKGLHNYNETDLLTAVRFVEAHYQHFPFEKLVGKDFTLDEVNEAFEYAVAENPFRVGIRLD